MPKQHSVPAAEAKQRVSEWFFHPHTPTLAWKELSWRQIGVECNVSYTQARRYLPPLVMRKYDMTLEEINDLRWTSAVVRKVPGVKRPKGEIAEMKKARKKLTIDEVADRFRVSPTTVQRHTSKKRKQEKY